MYYKLMDDILFRQYGEYGLITDNSEYGYRMLKDTRMLRGEKYVSQSGAVMLEKLGRIPKNIDDIVNELLKIFVGVEFDVLKYDTEEFFQELAKDGFLCVGETFDECSRYKGDRLNDFSKVDCSIASESDNCRKNIFKINDFLRSIHVEIANACNERCVHCYIPHKYKTDIMDSELFYRILNEGRDMNIIHITISGGEPLLHKDIIGFLRKCKELDLSVNILSNLTVLTDEIVEEMKKNPLLSVQTSIYSMNPMIHDSITMLQGSLEKTVNGVKKLINANIPVQISCPVMKANSIDFVSVIRWGYENNISVAIEPVIFASYDHTGENLSNRLSLDEIEKAFECQLQEGYGDLIINLAKEKEGMSGDDPICSICRYSFCVSVKGEVYPCVGWQTNVVGDMKRNSLREIWEHSERIQDLRKIKRSNFPKCVNCKDRGYCTVCMMSNSNENQDADVFRINPFHCSVAEIKHKKISSYNSEC